MSSFSLSYRPDGKPEQPNGCTLSAAREAAVVYLAIYLDHEGIETCTCLPSGEDLRAHRKRGILRPNASTDGRRIVYHAGADSICRSETGTQVIPVELYSPQTQRNRKFVSAERYLEAVNFAQGPFHRCDGGQALPLQLGRAVLQHSMVETGPEPSLDPSKPATAVRVVYPTG
jgi:hypothetical protein